MKRLTSTSLDSKLNELKKGVMEGEGEGGREREREQEGGDL